MSRLGRAANTLNVHQSGIVFLLLLLLYFFYRRAVNDSPSAPLQWLQRWSVYSRGIFLPLEPPREIYRDAIWPVVNTGAFILIAFMGGGRACRSTCCCQVCVWSVEIYLTSGIKLGNVLHAPYVRRITTPKFSFIFKTTAAL